MSDQIPSAAEPTFDENVATVLQALPLPVQEFLTSPERDAVTVRLMAKYQLHIDQTSQFQRAFVFMLMGIFTPDRFMEALTEAGIPTDTAESLMNDVNEEVFKPILVKERLLQEQETRAPLSASTQRTELPLSVPTNAVAPPTPPVVAVRQPEPAPTPIYVPPTPVVPALAPPPAPGAPTPIPVPVVQTPIPAPVSVPPSVVQAPPVAIFTAPSTHEEHEVRTMASDMQALREHRVPEPTFTHAAPVEPAPVAPPLSPVAQTSTPTMPQPVRSAPPPPNLPGTPLVTSYGVDPYREPVE